MTKISKPSRDSASALSIGEAMPNKTTFANRHGNGNPSRASVHLRKQRRAGMSRAPRRPATVLENIPFYSVASRAFMLSGSGTSRIEYTGDALMLALLLHAKGPARTAENEAEVGALLNDPNLEG